MTGIHSIGEEQENTHWSASRRSEQRDFERSHGARLDESIADLTARLMSLSVTVADERAAGYAAAVERLAAAFSASRVTLLLPDAASNEPRLRAETSWEAPAPGAHADVRQDTASERTRHKGSPSQASSQAALELDLTLAPALRSALEAGLACEAIGDVPLLKASPFWDELGRKRRWKAASRRLLIPCIGPREAGRDRLLGVLLIEGGLSARDWTKRLIVRASDAATSLATFLERARMARELDQVRAARARSAPLEALGETARSVAHDFNNLLTAIQGYADLAELELAENALGRESLGEIQRAASRAARLVDEILRAGRPSDTAGENPRAQEVESALPLESKDSLDLVESLSDLSGLIAQVVGSATDVRIAVDPKLPAIRADRDAFDRTMLNLAANARDAIAETTRKGLIEIEARLERVDPNAPSTSAAREFVRLSFSDNGVGIPEGVRDRLFERGFTTKPPGRGNGLGLAGAADLMRACGGRICVAHRAKSERHGGTAFHLDFPIG